MTLGIVDREPAGQPPVEGGRKPPSVGGLLATAAGISLVAQRGHRCSHSHGRPINFLEQVDTEPTPGASQLVRRDQASSTCSTVLIGTVEVSADRDGDRRLRLVSVPRCISRSTPVRGPVAG